MTPLEPSPPIGAGPLPGTTGMPVSQPLERLALAWLSSRASGSAGHLQRVSLDLKARLLELGIRRSEIAARLICLGESRYSALRARMPARHTRSIGDRPDTASRVGRPPQLRQARGIEPSHQVAEVRFDLAEGVGGGNAGPRSARPSPDEDRRHEERPEEHG